MRSANRIVLATVILSISAPLHSQEEASLAPDAPSDSLLWKDLRYGQSISSVSEAFATYPEVKSVKIRKARGNRPPELQIRLQRDKFQIFGVAFEAQPEFSDAGLLVSITLTSGVECANEAVERGNAILSTLEDKYGRELSDSRGLDDITVSSALYDSYRTERSAQLNYIFADEKIAVAFVIGFNSPPPPATAYGSKLANALSALSQSLYESSSQACGGTGNERAAYVLKYMPRSDLDAELEKTEQNAKEQRAQADANL